MMGMENYWRMGLLSSYDSEHRSKDGRKAKRSLGPVPCPYLSLPRQMAAILCLKISRAVIAPLPTAPWVCMFLSDNQEILPNV
jgi:hypothetical protein